MTDAHLLSTVLDGVVVVLLVTVIFFASRLSLYLREFRASRKDMDRLIRELSSGVERADAAMAGLREAARESGRDLQSMINEATSLVDELQLMSEAANNMACRMETVVEKKGRSVPASAPVTRKEASFAIRDPEFFASDDEADNDEYEEFEEETSGLQSRAERELFEALQGTQRKKTRV